MIFEGIVEDDFRDSLNPSENYGYVRVRVFSKHTDDLTQLPTEDLPKFKILYSAESNIDEQSYFRTICNGTCVIVAYLDKEEQRGIVLGSVVKTVNKIPDPSKGFVDKTHETPSQEYLGESTISRLARNENTVETIVNIKETDLETNITCGLTTFSQPAIGYNAEYPYNRVLQTKKHIIEIDDTDGEERINIYHNSGSFMEILSDGSKVEKVKGQNFLSITNNCNVIAHSNVNLRALGNLNIQATNITLTGNVNITGNLVVSGTATTGTINLSTHTHSYSWTGSPGSGFTLIPV